MHLEDDFILRVSERFHVVIVIHPGPGTSPGIAFGKDVLRGGSDGADAINSSLVKLHDKGIIHVMVLVVYLNTN
jgi:hypothetical protein